jgi:hypothetical protein
VVADRTGIIHVQKIHFLQLRAAGWKHVPANRAMGSSPDRVRQMAILFREVKM